MKLIDRNQVNRYFAELLASMPETRIKAVFAPFAGFSYVARQRIYDTDELLIIQFEDDTYWIIQYRYINSFEIEMRPLNEEEKKMLDEDTLGDCFNNELVIQNTEKEPHTEKVNLEYSRLVRVEAQAVQHSVETWQNGEIVEVMLSEDSFGNIVFLMENGKSFYIYPGDPYDGGDMCLTSNDIVDRQGDMQILSRGQELLVDYFFRIGMELAEAMYVAMLVWEEEATVEMLQYLLETHDTDYDHIIEVAKKLSIKYPLQDDDDE